MTWFLKDYLLHDYTLEIHEITKQTKKDGRKRDFLDKIENIRNKMKNHGAKKPIVVADLILGDRVASLCSAS